MSAKDWEVLPERRHWLWSNIENLVDYQLPVCGCGEGLALPVMDAGFEHSQFPDSFVVCRQIVYIDAS